MEFTRDRIGNATPFARQQAISSLIPVPEGLITDSSQPSLRAVGALNGVDQPIHYTRQGPRNLDGSWRMIRAQYAADSDAGAAGFRGYQHWSEKSIPIEVGDAGPLPSDMAHPAVDLSKLRIEFETQMQGIASANFSPANNFGAAGPVRTWRIDPLNSTHRELRSPWTQITTPRTELPDTVGSGGRHMRAYMVTARLLPEGEDGAGGGPQDVTEPSLWANLFYEVASGDLDGWGRATRFWVQIGHSFAAPTADSRAPDYPMARFVSPPKLRIYSATPATDPIDVVIYGDKAFLPEPATPIAGGIEFGLTNWDPNVGTANANEDLRGYDTLHDGISRLYQGVVYWRGGAALTTSEQNTRAAILHGIDADAPGHDCVQYAITENLYKFKTYGAFGIVTKPSEDGWDIEDLRNQVAAQDRRFYGFYTVDNARDAWQEIHLGTPRYTNAPAAQRNFGSTTFMAWAMSGHPGVRPLWLCASQEAWRWHHMRKVDGEPWRWDEFRTAGTPSTYDSSCVFGDGRPWWSSNFRATYPSQADHKSWSLQVGRWGNLQVSSRKINNFEISTPRGRAPNGLKGYDFQHFVQNAWTAFTHLTGDRWCLDGELVDQINLVICSRQTFPDQNRGSFAWSTEGIGVPRAEARWLRSLCHVGNLATRSEDEEVFFKRYAERIAWQKYIGTNNTPNAPTVFGDWQSDLLDELPELSRDNVNYFQQGGNNRYRICSTGLPAWDENPEGWSHWHIGPLTSAQDAVFEMSARDPNATRRAQAQADARFILEKITGGASKFGWETLPGGERRGFYAVPADALNMTRGRAPLESEYGINSSGYSLCDENGNPRTDPFFGTPIPGTNGIPSFRRSGRNLGTKWSGLTALLAWKYLQDDPEVVAAVEELMVTNPIYPDAATRRATLFSDLEPWQDFWAVIPDPFTWPKMTSGGGPVTYNESSTTSVILNTSSSEEYRVNEGSTTTVTITSESEDALFEREIQESGTTTVTVNTFSDEVEFGPPIQNQQDTLTLEVVTSSAESLRFEESSTVTLIVTSQSTERAEATVIPDPVANLEVSQTLTEAIGPDYRRSRSARIIETGRKFQRLIPGQQTGKGRPPRSTDQDPYRSDGR